MTLPGDIALLPPESIAALQSLIGFSCSGKVTAPFLTLRPRGQFTSEGFYVASWDGFIICPKISRFSTRQDLPPPLHCRLQIAESMEVFAHRLAVDVWQPAETEAAGFAGHATGAASMFPVTQIQVLSRLVSFPLTDVDERAPPVMADVGIRLIVTTPKGTSGGFSLLVHASHRGLYFQREDGSPLASLHEDYQQGNDLEVRMTLE